MVDVSLSIALLAGALSFFSPCVLPLIPAYITYITGTTLEEELENKKLFALSRTIGFIIGFTIIFMIMGVSVSFLGRFFLRNKNILNQVSGILIMFFGVNMMGLINLRFLGKSRKPKAPKITSWASSIFMGMAFATGWTPCVGAVLGTILVYAGTSTTVATGAFLLLAYSIGLGIPFILTSLLITKFSKFLVKSERMLPYIMKISGVIVFIFGILIFFNLTGYIAAWFI